jgi:hypothetical protein
LTEKIREDETDVELIDGEQCIWEKGIGCNVHWIVTIDNAAENELTD